MEQPYDVIFDGGHIDRSFGVVRIPLVCGCSSIDSFVILYFAFDPIPIYVAPQDAVPACGDAQVKLQNLVRFCLK